MLVDVEKIATFPWSPLLAQIRTPLGRTAVRWCGAQDDPAGPYHVEWTIDEEITWGRNAKPATDSSPRIEPGGHCVVLRGQLHLMEDGGAVLALGDARILLELTERLPVGVAGTWVELYLDREKISLYPVTL